MSLNTLQRVNRIGRAVIIAVVFGVVTFGTAFYAIAWTNPTENPPYGNVAPPVNTGATLQTKSGSFFSSATLSGDAVNATSTLCIAGDCKANWSEVSTSQWTTSGNDIYYTTGNAAIGTTSFGAALHALNSSGDNILKLSRGISTSTILRVGTDGALVIQNQSNDTLTLKNSQIIAGAAQGTAPFVVNSTTKVASLNADLLDGLDSSAFGDATVANQTTILNRMGTSGDAGSLTPTTLFAGVKGIIGQVDSTYATTATLMGIGSAPACPVGWTEIVGQTAAGSLSPITSISTTGIAPITSINTGTLRGWVCAGRDYGEGSMICGTSDTTDAPYVKGGSATSYTVAAGGSATIYTFYYRLCGLPR